ncbi:MAG: hypothetical protein ACFFBP_09820 [Promethearchaeota archaeon]
MPGIDPETAVYNLMQRDPSIIAAAVIDPRNNIIYSTDNWDITPDIGRVMSSWNSLNAQFIMISGVKYSMLAQTPEGFTATSIRGEGHIVGAKDEERRLIAYLEPDGNLLGAQMDVQRTIGDMSTKGTYLEDTAQLGQKAQQMGGSASTGGSSVSSGSLDPQLKGEIQAFLDWIKDSEGLAGYIKYYIDQNNAQIISALAQVYSELRQIFGV